MLMQIFHLLNISFCLSSALDRLSIFRLYVCVGLQCFDAVGWVAGRASGL